MAAVVVAGTDRPFLVLQGGGDPAVGHCCAGERVTVELLKCAVRVLVGLGSEVSGQDLPIR